MRIWPARILFAGLLVGSLTAKDGAIDLLATPPDLEPAVIRVAKSGGLTFRQKTTFAGTDIPVLIFGAANCSLPVLVALLSLTLEEDPTIRSSREPGYALRYVYIERSWEEPSRPAVYVERAKYAALAMLRLTRYTPFRRVLLVETPRHCSAAGDVDWQGIWRATSPPDLLLRTPAPQQLGAQQNTPDRECGWKPETYQWGRGAANHCRAGARNRESWDGVEAQQNR